jgi:hypothetical protein
MGTSARTFRGTAERIESVPVNANGLGANVIVPAEPNRIIVVLSYKIVCADAVSVTWESGGGDVLDGPCAFAANGGESTSDSENGHFATKRGEALVMDLSAPVQVGGHLKYALV